MARVACRGQVQPVTVQSKAVEKPEKKLDQSHQWIRRFRDLTEHLRKGNAHFSLAQMTAILNDYVEAAIMLDDNDRDVAAAWY